MPFKRAIGVLEHPSLGTHLEVPIDLSYAERVPVEVVFDPSATLRLVLLDGTTTVAGAGVRVSDRTGLYIVADTASDEAGRVYVGSLGSDPFSEPRKVPGALYRIDAEGDATELYAGVGLSNGIGFSPGEHLLYHADTAARAILVYEMADNAPAILRRTLAMNGNPDGLAVDEHGYFWVALFGGGRVERHSPFGLLDDAIHVPARNVTSVCFGGADRRDLYIVTADNTDAPERRGTIFRTRVEVPGLPAPLARI